MDILYATENERIIYSDLFKENNKKRKSLLFGIFFQLLMLVRFVFIKGSRTEITEGKKVGISKSITCTNVMYKAFTDEIIVLEDLGLKTSLLKYVKKGRLQIELTAFLKALSDINTLYSCSIIDPNSYYFYVLRVFHFEIYKISLKAIIQENNLKELYSGQMTDRFSFAEFECCANLKVKRICIPHGLEPLDKLTNCIPGNRFYCHSDEAAHMLNEMYRTNQFIFSEELIERISDFRYDRHNRDSIVFFTQAFSHELDEISYSYIEKLNNYVKHDSYFGRFYVKLHPADNEEIYKEKFPDIDFINDMKLAITSNVCVSFFSTCLFEALYNDSTSISIIVQSVEIPLTEVAINKKIHKVRDFNELAKLLDSLKEDK